MEGIEKNLGLNIGSESVHRIEEIKSCLDRARSSKWIDDKVEIEAKEGGLILRNTSKTEEVDTLVLNFKIKVSDYALELLDFKENDSLTPGKENQILLGDIKGYKDQIDEQLEKRKSLEVTLRESNWTSDSDENLNFLRAVSISADKEIYGKKMIMRDFINHLEGKLE